MTIEHTIIGLIDSQRQAERILTALEGAGLAKDDVSVLLCAEPLEEVEDATCIQGLAAAGAGPAHGGGLALWGRLALSGGVAIVVIPGAGSFAAAGPVLEALSGEVGAGSSRSIAGTLFSMGIPLHEAQQYETKVKGGGVLVAVHAGEHEERALAKAVLREGRASDVSTFVDHSVSTQSSALRM